MLGREGIHWRVVVNNVLFRINTVVSKAEVVERIVHFMKPVILYRIMRIAVNDGLLGWHVMVHVYA